MRFSRFPRSRPTAKLAAIVTMPYRILSLLLCLLAAGPMSLPAWALARPENRVGNSFSSPLQSASADRDQTLGKSDRIKVNLNDRLLGVGTPARYVYDSNGNTISDTLGTSSTADDVADEYDSENRLARRTVGVSASPRQDNRFAVRCGRPSSGEEGNSGSDVYHHPLLGR